jgi:hypothetical protein
MSQSPGPGAPFGLRWQDHLGLITTVVLTVATVMNIAAAGGWDTQTSLALLRSMGGVSVLTASLISLSPSILSGITSALCAYLVYRRITERPKSARFRMAFITAIGLVLLGLLVLPVILWLITLLGIVSGLLFGLADRGESREARNASMRLFLSFLLGPFFLLLFLGVNWFPSENLEFSDSSKNASAYVVDVQDDQLTLLTIRTRRVVYVRDHQLRKREICSLTETFWFKRVFQLTSPPATVSCMPPIS